MTRYTIEYDKPVLKDLKAIRNKRLAAILRSAINDLADDPRPPGVKKLVGHRDLWRIRVGDWRVVYRVEDGRLVIVVVAVGGRGGVYGLV